MLMLSESRSTRGDAQGSRVQNRFVTVLATCIGSTNGCSTDFRLSVDVLARRSLIEGLLPNWVAKVIMGYVSMVLYMLAESLAQVSSLLPRRFKKPFVIVRHV